MDIINTTATLLKLKASDSEYALLTDFNETISFEGYDYVPSDGISFELPAITADLDTKECLIKNIPLYTSFVLALAENTPFSRVEVSVIEVVLDDDLNISDPRYLFSGLLYQCSPKPTIGVVDLTCRDYKYYTDITAGMACTEQCGWAVFGGLGCGASVPSESHVVTGITGNVVTLQGPLENTTTTLYNKGYMEYKGSHISIKYHSTGLSFEMSKFPPPSWLGKIVTIYAGCDRSLDTCKTIHNNEANFLGLGYCMVDYNPLYEEA